MSSAILKGLSVILLAYFLFFHGMSDAGLLGPDEPRYASIGREMSFTGDWVTPRLWGEAWFEKPALVYWVAGWGYLAGLDEEAAPRAGVAVASCLFLLFLLFWLRREFGWEVAWIAVLVLASSAGWLAFSRLCTTDLLLSAAFGASILLLISWAGHGDRRVLLPAGILLGVAVLAKGLVPVVLSVPVVWFGRKRFRDLAAYYGFAAVVAAPWYVLCAMENGLPFLKEFFWRQQFARFASPELQHVQPVWFYLPVLVAGFLPWTPLLIAAGRKRLYTDPRLRFLLAIVVFALVFFSASTNKLPGYLLPLFPPLAVLCAAGIASWERARSLLAASAALTGVAVIAASILPAAVRSGLSRAGWADVSWWRLAPVVVLAAGVWWLAERKRGQMAVWAVAGGVALGVVYVVSVAFPVLDTQVSARGLWRQIAPRSQNVCVERMHRSLRYGLNYYSLEPLPDCSARPRPLHIIQKPGELPVVVLR